MYTLTVTEHEMGAQPFVEMRFKSLGEALAEATVHVTKVVTDPKLEEWSIVDPTDCCEFEVQYVLTEGDLSDPDEGLVSVDYILEVRKD